MQIKNIAINYTLPEADATAGRRWLRIEQVQQDASVSMGDAAAAIDALFGLEPCTNGLGNGGQMSVSKAAADGLPVQMPSEEQTMATLRDRLDLSVCDQKQHWETWVDVYKSHQTPVSVELVSETAEIAESELIIEGKTELLQVSGRSVDLSWPYHSGIIVSGGQVDKIEGSTVFLDADTDGYLSTAYNTSYERVRVLVPIEAKPMASADADGHAAAAVIAFWADMAASCELQQPAEDSAISERELKRLCGSGSAGSTTLNDVTPLECWKTLRHYTKCTCSQELARSWEEEVPASCPEGVQPGVHHVGVERVFEGYVHCDGEEDNVYDPAFFEHRCCWPPNKPLPRCWESYALWRGGGAEIEGGPQKYIDTYGPNVRLKPVMPPDGICGNIITEYRYRFKSCCDGVPEMSIDPDAAPEVMADNSEAYLQILGGMGPYTVSTESTGLYIDQIGTKRMQTMGTLIRLRSTEMCGAVSVHIADACGQTATHLIRATNGKWEYMPVPDSWCIHGGTPPVFYLTDSHGDKYITYAADLSMVFTYYTPRFLAATTDEAEPRCTSIVGPSTGSYNCGLHPIVKSITPYEFGMYHYSVACWGAWNKSFRRWVC